MSTKHPGRAKMAIRPCKVVGEVCLVPLTQGQTAVVDAEDYEMVSQHNWFAAKVNRSGFYALRYQTENRQPLAMHRSLMGVTSPISIDHVDGDTLNNRRSNLRICTNQQNQWNQKPRAGGSSKFKGVCRVNGKWHAGIQVSMVQIGLGRFTDESDAARAYDRAALENFGEFAWLNFPEARVA